MKALLPLFLLIFCIPFAFAHPDPTSATVENENGTLPNLKIIGLYPEDKDQEIKFPSIQWVWKHFIYLLGGIIIGIMTLITALSYRFEIINKYPSLSLLSSPTGTNDTIFLSKYS